MNDQRRDPQDAGDRSPLDQEEGSRLPHPGLCATCRHAVRVPTSRGATFWRCGRAATDPRYAKYPALPVTRCEGHVRREC